MVAGRTLIVNARIVNEGTVSVQDCLIEGERIAGIGRGLPSEGATVIDADGRHLIPGVIDDQVHFRDPGMREKATVASESRAAVAGGVTSFMEMPNTAPPAVDAERLQAKYDRAADCSLANYSFYMGATNTNIEELRRVDPQSVCGIKVFMGSSTGNMLVDDEQALDAIFRDAPCLVATHCEDTPTIVANEAKFREEFGEAVPISAHPEIRSVEACWRSSSMAVELAKRHDTRLHVLHLTTAREMELFDPGPVAGKRITGEACVHHLWFCDEDYERLGAQIKCNPAIKRSEDRAALRQAVLDDRLDVIATDHAPHTWEEKQRSYFQAPSGLPLVQHSLPALLTMYQQGIFPLETIVHKTSHAVAECFRIAERGYIREGYFADLVLVDTEAQTTVTPESLHYRCGWSPFTGTTLGGRIDRVWVNGHAAMIDGRLDDSQLGQRLRFDRG